MGEPEDMSIRLLKEVLDDLNDTYKSSERKRDLISKVRQARERLQESHCQQDAPSHFALYRNNDYMDDQSQWHNSSTFKASALFPLIYYDDRKERLRHLLFQLIFLFELLALYLARWAQETQNVAGVGGAQSQRLLNKVKHISIWRPKVRVMIFR